MTKKKRLSMSPEAFERAREKDLVRQRKFHASSKGKASAREYYLKTETQRRYQKYHLNRTYGITLDDFDRMLAEQGGGCAICGGPAGGPYGRFSVDHDHSTGLVRALLCAKCNVGLGSFDDDPLRLELAAKYLREHAY